MRISEILSESPIGDWQVDPDFDANRSSMLGKRPEVRQDLEHWQDSDINAIRSHANVSRVKNVFSKCPFTFNLYFVHSEQVDYDSFMQAGHVDLPWVAKIFGPQIAGRIEAWSSPTAINVIMTNNMSDEDKLSLRSPWMVAHRMAHAIMGGHNTEPVQKFEGFIQDITRIGYSIEWPNEDSHHGRSFAEEYKSTYGKILGYSLGTMNSARRGRLVTVHEWYYETFAQYLITGKVTLKPLPERFDVFGLTKDPKARYKVQKIWARFPEMIEKTFERSLNDAKGGLWVI